MINTYSEVTHDSKRQKLDDEPDKPQIKTKIYKCESNTSVNSKGSREGEEDESFEKDHHNYEAEEEKVEYEDKRVENSQQDTKTVDTR